MEAFGSHGEDTGLDSLLKENKIDTIFCCGLAYDICVGETALSGAKLGYRTYLIADASKDRLKSNAESAVFSQTFPLVQISSLGPPTLKATPNNVMYRSVLTLHRE